MTGRKNYDSIIDAVIRGDDSATPPCYRSDVPDRTVFVKWLDNFMQKPGRDTGPLTEVALDDGTFAAVDEQGHTVALYGPSARAAIMRYKELHQ